ncbi:MAG: hypothetical protein Tsb0021_12230 [Chlamydiales bacterium]
MRESLYDPLLPSSLQSLQTWFGSIISRPLGNHNKIEPLTPSGNTIETESMQWIIPSPTLKPFERIQIYNQQYWWRLLKIMHDNFPLVTRMFGHEDFNRCLAIPYLQKFPPNTWSLNPLGSRFPRWVDEEYHEEDRALVFDATLIDSNYNDHFVVQEHPLLDHESASNIEELLKVPLKLQPHISLYHLPYHLFKFRDEMLTQEVDHWIENDFPKMEHGDFYFILFRNFSNGMQWESCTRAEYTILQYFLTGCTIECVCEWIESEDEEVKDEAAKHLSGWFEAWVSCRWLSLL